MLLTHIFSVQQKKHLFEHQDRQNSLFRQCEKIYVSKMMRFETASGASSLISMNGYVSENSVFLFCERMAVVEKNGSMLLGKFMRQSQFDATWYSSACKADLQQSDEKLFVRKAKFYDSYAALLILAMMSL